MIKQFPLALTYDDIQIVPQYSSIKTRNDINLTTQLTKNHKINIPFISAPMDTVTELEMAIAMGKFGAVGAVHRFIPIENHEEIINNLYLQKLNIIIATIGLNDQKRLYKLLSRGANVILIDVAHGNTKYVVDEIKFYKKEYPNIDLIAGNVATKEGAQILCEAGVDAIRCGIGSGSLCETRIKTGIGIPMVTSIVDCVEICDNFNVPVIADGGIRIPGDAAKALALGASTVMLGSLLAGTKESPGIIRRQGLWPNEKLYKKYRGSASLEIKQDLNLKEKNVEGNSMLIDYKGKIERILGDLSDGIRSSLSYVGATNLNEFELLSKFVRITQNGLNEAQAHLLKNNM